MASKVYAYVGNFFFAPKKKGLSTYAYDETNGSLKKKSTIYEEIGIGQQYLDSEKNVLYVLDESESLDGQIGGGGQIFALSIDPHTGSLQLLNSKKTLGSFPCSVIVDKSKRFLLVVHHGEMFHVNKIARNKDGEYVSKVLFDDTPISLFSLNPDGSLGKLVDVSITKGDQKPGNHYISRLHSITVDPTGELYVVCDKGTDQIYSFKIDREKGKLIFLKKNKVQDGLAPRYGVFHPKLPIFYGNNEKKSKLISYSYNISNGELQEKSRIELVLSDTEIDKGSKVEASDILMHPNQKFIYVSIRGAEIISVVKLSEQGEMKVIQNINCMGINPRGIVFSPDNNYIFSQNMESGTITKFEILANGMLQSTDTIIDDNCPANMTFLKIKEDEE